MLIQFFRHINVSDNKEKPDTVTAKMSVSRDGRLSQVGILEFPDKMTWSVFYGALSNGAVPVRDLEVRMENAPDSFGMA